MRAEAVEQRLQIVEVGKVAHADRATPDLVFICRADAAARRTDLAGTAGVFAKCVEVAMDRKDERASFRDSKHIGGDVDALLANALDLGLQRPGVEDDAVADDGRRAANDARRQKRKLVGLLADDQRVAGIVPALEAHHHVGAACQPVDDLALAFVAPLGADDGHVSHDESLF